MWRVAGVAGWRVAGAAGEGRVRPHAPDLGTFRNLTLTCPCTFRNRPTASCAAISIARLRVLSIARRSISITRATHALPTWHSLCHICAHFVVLHARQHLSV